MPRPRKIREPKRHTRSWHTGTVKEVRPGVWRAWRERTRNADGTVTRPSRTFSGPTAQADAAVWAAGEPQTAVMYLGQWLERWSELRGPTWSPRTVHLIDEAITACGPLLLRPISEITTDEWQAQANVLLERWARSHVAVWRRHITIAIRAAMPDHLATNTLRRIVLPAKQVDPPKAWRQDEIDRLLADCEGKTHEAWALFSLGTGVRLGEARALYWEDVNIQGKTATIRASLDDQTDERGPTKTRRIRVIDIPDELGPVLVAHRARQPAGQQLVFGHGKRAYDSDALRKWLKRRCEDAGVRKLSTHSFRHTYASLAIDAGVPITEIARQLGHSVMVCQSTYAHFIGEGQRRAANAIGSALRHRFSGPKLVDGTQNGTRTGV